MKKFLKSLLNVSAFGIFNHIPKIKNLFKGINSGADSLSSWFSDIGPKLGGYADNFLKAISQSGVTQQQTELNDMQMQNIADQYPKSVEGMQAAGLNPALMYKSGATSAPTAPGLTSNGSMSDLMELIMLPLNKKMLQAQVANVEADTKNKEITNLNLDEQMKAAIQSTLSSAESTKIDTLYRSLLIHYGMPEAEVNRVLKDIEVGDSTISRNEAEADFSRANAAYLEVKKKIELDKLPFEIASMSASAKESLARSIVEEFRGAYMQQNHTDVPNGAIASLVGLISNSFHGLEKDVDAGKSGWDEMNNRTLFPFIDMILRAFGK